MSVVIRGYNKPKDCYSCRFNDNDCQCSVTKGTIDRDDYTCNVLCPIEQLPRVGSEAESEKEEPDYTVTENTPCTCFGCKKIITDGRIFRLKGRPERGLCFDCY